MCLKNSLKIIKMAINFPIIFSGNTISTENSRNNLISAIKQYKTIKNGWGRLGTVGNGWERLGTETGNCNILVFFRKI